jgi:hypothetical protein
MAKRRSNLPSPAAVRRLCTQFLGVLEKYDKLQLRSQVPADETTQEKRNPNIGAARELWKLLERYGRPLLEAGIAWNMVEWVSGHQEWLRLEHAWFFDEETTEIEYRGWGFDLECFLWWGKATRKPFGLSGREGEDYFSAGKDVLEDVQRDVRSLEAAAIEQIAGKPSNVEVRPPLSERETAILGLIPRCKTEQAITEKEIVNKLRNTVHQIDRGTLSSRVIPKLKAHYSVEHFAGVGYCRH